MILNVMQHGDLSSITTDTWKTVSEPCENDLTISNVAENTVLGIVQHLPLFFYTTNNSLQRNANN